MNDLEEYLKQRRETERAKAKSVAYSDAMLHLDSYWWGRAGLLSELLDYLEERRAMDQLEVVGNPTK